MGYWDLEQEHIVQNATVDPSLNIISEGICSIIGPRYIYLCVNDFNSATNNDFIAAFSSSVLSPHILARINYQSLVQRNGIYMFGDDDDYGDTFHKIRKYFGPVDIQKITLSNFR